MPGLLNRNAVAALLVRLLFFAGLWALLTGGGRDSWVVGVPAVVLAAASSVALLPPATLVWRELLRFVPFFLRRSLLGGLDVARRTLQPKMPIAPALVDYRLLLPAGLAQVVMLNTVSLLPGTLAADVQGEHVIVHVLDATSDWRTDIEAVEQQVARLFGIALEREGGD